MFLRHNYCCYIWYAFKCGIIVESRARGGEVRLPTEVVLVKCTPEECISDSTCLARCASRRASGSNKVVIAVTCLLEIFMSAIPFPSDVSLYLANYLAIWSSGIVKVGRLISTRQCSAVAIGVLRWTPFSSASLWAELPHLIRSYLARPLLSFST